MPYDDVEGLAGGIRDDLDGAQAVLRRLHEHTFHLLMMLDNGDTDLGAREDEIRLSVELVNALALNALGALREVERACDRAEGLDLEEV